MQTTNRHSPHGEREHATRTPGYATLKATLWVIAIMCAIVMYGLYPR